MPLHGSFYGCVWGRGLCVCTYSSVPSSSPSGPNNNSPIYVFKDGNLITVCSTCLGPFLPLLHQGNPNVGPRAYVKVEKRGEGRKHYLSSHPPKPTQKREGGMLLCLPHVIVGSGGKEGLMRCAQEGRERKESSCRSREGK